MSKSSEEQLPERIERELTALADGSLTGERRERALARALASPELSAALAEQQRAVALLRAVEATAPAALHERIGAMAATGQGAGAERVGGPGAGRRRRGFRPSFLRSAPPRWRPARLLAATAAAAVLVAAVATALALSGSSGRKRPGGFAALSVRSAAALALGPATLPAPSESPTDRSELSAAVEGVAFPYWGERFGWRGSGARSDTLGSRAVTTVFYTDASGRRIGYAIVAGRTAATPGSGTLVRRRGVFYRLSSQDGASVIAWRRDGHLCVIAGRGVSASTLLRLASWGSERARTA